MLRRRIFFPIDDSTFTNDFYMACYSEYFSKLLLHLCQKNNRENILTSDGISGAMLRAIYQKLYCLQFITPGELEFDLMTSRSVSNVVQTPSGRCRVYYKHPDVERAEHIEADIIILATDYVAAEKNLLNGLKERIHYENDVFVIDDDFAIVWVGPR
ncbi:hypothetical protein B4Q89_04045 [Salmonella enterica]|nr:hypothetical protein LFZ50_18870 [Salmonella enterica subsp. arizonae serovar 53:-:- str. SA20100345]EAA5367163.1 hypothetical protein [Salmonella enterica subsp. arizonae]EAN3421303.1 hypothetical protein [Salmonella enterica]ECK9492234.1 hypothetical protein [Salmonella enterica subsp. arizonae str. CFSAN000561]ECT9551762.1 hypothetical protein [Salmonella enterica subsp. arizonae serovar 41:z4,z23:-]EDS4369194.1 SidA/IucD/PvdA family monooxygenase [Salmonella enterica subsp. enterica ser